MLYQKYSGLLDDFEKLTEQPSSVQHSHKIAGLSSWRIKAFCAYRTVNNKSFLYLAGPYIQDTKDIEKLPNSLSRLMVEKNCLKISPHQKSKQPTMDMFESALDQRIQCTRSENDKRLPELSRTCQLLHKLTAGTSNISFNYLGVDDLIILSAVLCWLEEKQRYAAEQNRERTRNLVFLINKEKGLYINFSEKDGGITALLLSGAKHYEGLYLRNGEPVEPIGLSITQIRNTILSNRHNLHRNVVDQMSHLLNRFTGINYFQNPTPDSVKINTDVKRACHAICSLLCRATGADSAQLFIVNHAGSNLLETIGIFARDPQWLIANKITDHLNKSKDKMYNDMPRSFVIRAIGKKPVFEPKLDKTNSNLTSAYGHHTPRSGIAVPLSIHGRVLGVLQIKGAHYEQFSRRWFGIFTQTADLLAPFIYQLRMTNTLSQIQQLLAGEIDFSTQQEKLNQASKKLNDILLIDEIHFLIKDENLVDSFSIKGHNYEKKISKEGKVENISTRINLSDKNRLLNNFPGFVVGKTTNDLLMKEKHRFDYLHCEYHPERNQITGKSYSSSKNINSFEIINFMESLSNFSQILYKDKKNDGLGMKEILVFPIVSPPTYLKDTQKNIFLDEDHGLLILGFVVAHNKIYRPLGPNWENIIQACSQAISIGIYDSGAPFTIRSKNERLIRHELRAYTTQIIRTLRSLSSRAQWLHRKMQENSYAITPELEATTYISSQLKLLEDTVIPELHTQLEYQKSATTLQKLGIHADIMHDEINVIAFLKDQMHTFEDEKKKAGQYIIEDLPGELWVEIHPVALRHLFDNILSNAFKYAPRHSTLEIKRLFKNSNCIRFTNKSEHSVNDSPTEDLKRFGIRNDKHVKNRDIDGEGVGLSIILILSRIFLKEEFSYKVGKEVQTHHLADGSVEHYKDHSITLDFSKVIID